MKSYYNVHIRTKSGKSFNFEYHCNRNDLMNSRHEEDICMHLLEKPYLCISERDGFKRIVPRDAIDVLEVKDSNT